MMYKMEIQGDKIEHIIANRIDWFLYEGNTGN